MNYKVNTIKHYNAVWNKYVLRRVLNALIETQSRMSMGREFHNLGAHEEKALSPYEENVFGILRRSLSEDLYERALSVLHQLKQSRTGNDDRAHRPWPYAN